MINRKHFSMLLSNIETIAGFCLLAIMLSALFIPLGSDSKPSYQ